jgi:uncharacterized membrane protein
MGLLTGLVAAESLLLGVLGLTECTVLLEAVLALLGWTDRCTLSLGLQDH